MQASRYIIPLDDLGLFRASLQVPPQSLPFVPTRLGNDLQTRPIMIHLARIFVDSHLVLPALVSVTGPVKRIGMVWSGVYGY
jgi:hypothetical protein